MRPPQGVSGLSRTQPAQGGDEASVDQSRKLSGDRLSVITVSLISCSVVSDSCDPIDCSLPGSSVHGILQARMLEWVAISFSSHVSQSLARS